MPSLLSPFLDLFFPPRCTFCDSISKEPICPKCAEAVKFISPPFCTVCGIPFESDSIKSHNCGDCLKKKRHFSWARSVLVYNDASAKTIQRYKYSPDTTLSKQLGSIISNYSDLYPGTPPSRGRGGRCPSPFDIKDFDIIIPVPLHIKRLRERGFNQSLLLAKAVGKRHGVQVAPFALKRSRWTKPQVSLPEKERMINVKGAFEVTGDVKSKRVLLVDDVYTTGATVSECSKVLKKSRATEVCVLTLARTTAM